MNPAEITTLAACAMVGGAFRTVFLLKEVYEKDGYIAPNWRRLTYDTICSVALGGFFSALLVDAGVFKVGRIFGGNGIAMIAGFFGPALGARLARFLGVKSPSTKRIQQLPEDLNQHQLKALNVVKAAQSVTNEEYRVLNKVSDSTAERDLSEMVALGFLRQIGQGRGTRYIF